MPCCGPPVYGQPTFILPISIWRIGNPVSNPADLEVMAQLKAPTWTALFAGAPPGGSQVAIPMILLLPALTDIRCPVQAGENDTCEVPTGSSRYYVVGFVDDVAKGFANEHRFALITQSASWPTPIP